MSKNNTLILDDLNGKLYRNIYLFTEINESTVQPLIQAIHDFNQDDKGLPVEDREPIHLYINSPGGCVLNALALVTAIETSDTPVYAYDYGNVASAATLIYSVCHIRYAYKHSEFMLHGVSTVHVGNIPDLEDQHILTVRAQKRVNEILKLYTDFKEEELEEFSKSRKDHWFDYIEAYDKKMVDYIDVPEVYEKDCKLIREKYPEPEVLHIDAEEFFNTVPMEEVKELLEKYKLNKSSEEDLKTPTKGRKKK